jgi:RimJ/RimL family protein N-acetyltransferase
MQAIQTERLILREFNLEDAPFLLELLNTPMWLQFIGDRGVRTVEGAAQYISDRFFKSYQTYGFGFYIMILKEGEIPIGTSGLIKRDGLDEVDMGFALLPQYEQKGYGFEAGQAVLSLAKDNFNFKKLLAITNQDNYNSQKLLVKLGFKKDKMVVLPNDTIELFLFEKEL